MAQSWDIDPSTGDYKMENGRPVETDRLTVPAYFRLKTSRNKWMYAPDDKFGSDFKQIKKRRSASETVQTETTAARALSPLVDDGRAREITVEAKQTARYAVGLEIKIKEAGGENSQLNLDSLGV